MTMRMRARAVVALVAVLSAGLVPGCGSAGSVVVGEFQQLVIGPGGGTAAAQNVWLWVPPGAFTEDHVVSILEQPTPLPIEPQGDGSTVVYHDNIMCIGPIDLDLLVPGRMRMCYPDSGYPKGLGEGDLVLLEWDEDAGLMRVVPGAVQDTTENCFEDTAYPTLGHVAIGLRIPGDEPPPPPEFEVLFFGEPAVAMQAPDGTLVPSMLWLMDIDGDLPDTTVPNTDDVGDYLGNGDGSRALYTTPRFQDKFSGISMRTFDVPSLADREVLAEDTFSPSEPYFGWHGFSDTIFFDEFDFSTLGKQVPTEGIATVPGAGGATTDFYPYKGGSIFYEDVRFSPDDTMVMLRFFDFSQEGSRSLFVVMDLLGNVLTEDLPTEVDFFDPMPRFLPDSSGVYYVGDDGVTVYRVDPDGTDTSVLYSLPAANSEILDFVVAPPFAPDPQRCAYVRRFFGEIQSEGVGGGPEDLFETDRLSGGDVQSFAFGTQVSIVDLVPLFSQGWQTSLVALQLYPESFDQSVNVAGFQGSPDGSTLFFNLGDAGLWTEIPAPLAHIDFSRQVVLPDRVRAGHALVWITFVDTESFPDFPEAGLYHLDPFLGSPSLLTPGWFVDGPGRWLESWRHVPGFSIFRGPR
jgi:hypothetical protein